MAPMHDSDALLKRVAQVLTQEGSAVCELATNIGDQVTAIVGACSVLAERCGDAKPGRLVVSGVGKAGLIGRKLAATFASTGTPAYFMHPAEAQHGDLGMVRSDDVVLLLSHSGNSEEIVALLPNLAHIGVPVIAITGDPQSPLGQHADYVLSIAGVSEACPLGLAPSTSTTVMLAFGDAIALSVLELRAFTPEEYARFHPGGALGRKLMTCAQAMRELNRIAVVAPSTATRDTVRAITSARTGCALVVDDDGKLAGIFTDGDLRRLLSTDVDPATVLAAPIKTYATMPCRSIIGSELVDAALHICAQHHIDELPVIDGTGQAIGLIDLQDLADRGFRTIN